MDGNWISLRGEEYLWGLVSITAAQRNCSDAPAHRFATVSLTVFEVTWCSPNQAMALDGLQPLSSFVQEQPVFSHQPVMGVLSRV